MSSSVYEMVTNQIIEQLENGTVPWRKPFKSGAAVNWKSQKPYRGINVMLLEPGEYATFNQIKEAGGKVKKGEKSSIIVFWKWIEKEDEDGEKETIPFLKYYRVFEINSQVEGMESKRSAESFDHDPIEKCEEIMKGYMDAPDYSYKTGGAWYRPSMDLVNVPPMKEFENVEEYYSTLFHECVHSTGHKKRLNREGVTGTISFGSEDYSKEELVAELGASMLNAVAGISNDTIVNSASYIASWLKVLKDDKKMIVTAGAQAQKAADFILGVKFEG